MDIHLIIKIGAVVTSFFLIPIFIISPKFFFLISFPLRALCNMLVNVGLFNLGPISLSVPEFFGLYQVIFAFLYIIISYKRLFLNKVLVPFVLFLFFLLFVITSSVSDINKLIDIIKILTWMFYFPIGFLLFHTEKDFVLLKKAAKMSSIIIILGVLYGQIYHIGDTAYDLGLLFLGFFPAEAPLGSSLLAGIIPLFISEMGQKKLSSYKVIDYTLFLILLCLIFCLMVRSMILSVFIFIASYILLTFKKSLFQKIIIIVGIGLINITLFLGLITVKPEYMSVRFKDFRPPSGDVKIESFGSGRVSLFEYYWNEFTSQNALMQLLGTDFYSLLNQSKTRTFVKKKMGTHNDVLQMLFIGGYVGLLLYIQVWLAAFWTLKKNFKFIRYNSYKKNIAIGISCIMVYFLLIFHGIIFHIYFMQVIAVIIGASLRVSLTLVQRHSI